MKGKRKREHITFILEGVIVTPAKSVNYLGIEIDEKRTFGTHVQMATMAEIKTANLTRLMPNLNGPRSSKRAVLSSAIHNIGMYGAPVWHEAIHVKKYRNKMERMQRKILMRVASSYRTASLIALQVITGTTLIDLMVYERAFMYRHAQEERTETARRAKEAGKTEGTGK